MLRTALGPAISGYLEDPGIVEVMLNPDGRLWIDRLAGGIEETDCRVTPADAERIVRLVAHRACRKFFRVYEMVRRMADFAPR